MKTFSLQVFSGKPEELIPPAGDASCSFARSGPGPSCGGSPVTPAGAESGWRCLASRPNVRQVRRRKERFAMVMTGVLDKRADLAGPGIGDYAELEKVLP